MGQFSKLCMTGKYLTNICLECFLVYAHAHCATFDLWTSIDAAKSREFLFYLCDCVQSVESFSLRQSTSILVGKLDFKVCKVKASGPEACCTLIRNYGKQNHFLQKCLANSGPRKAWLLLSRM